MLSTYVFQILVTECFDTVLHVRLLLLELMSGGCHYLALGSANEVLLVVVEGISRRESRPDQAILGLQEIRSLGESGFGGRVSIMRGRSEVAHSLG